MDSDVTYSLEEIYSHLRGFHLSESLYTIGAINSALKYGGDTFFTDNIPPYIIAWLYKFGNKIVSNLELTLQTSRMARLLLLSGASDESSDMLILGTPGFQKAFNMIGRVDEPGLDTLFKNEISVSRLFGRMSSWQFPLQSDRLIPIGRAYLLFIAIPSAINPDYDFNLKMKGFFNLSALEYLICGFSLWLTTNGTLDYELTVENKKINSIVTKENMKIMVSLITGSPKQYQNLIRGDDLSTSVPEKDLYSFDPFLTIPAISIEKSLKFRQDSFVVPQPKYLLDKISTGIFYLLADKEREIAKAEKLENKKNSFRNSFGMVYRQYVKNQLQLALTPIILIDLDHDFENVTGGKIPDFALLLDDTCILFEVKTSILTVESRTYFEEEKLKSEVKKGSVNKALQQLHFFRQQILQKKISDNRFRQVKRVINIMVCYEDIYVLNSSLLPLIKEFYGVMAESLQLACISDIDAIGYALAEGIDLKELFLRKISTLGTETFMIATIIESQIGRKNPLLRNAYKMFIDRMGVSLK